MLFKKPDDFGGGRFRFRRTRAAYRSQAFWWVSCVFLMLVLAGAITVTLIPSDPPLAQSVAAAQSAATALPEITHATETPEVSYTGCKAQDAPALDPEFNTPAPVTSTWRTVGYMKVPSSDTGGPQVGSVCFTRTPEGALYSAANFLGEFLALDPSARPALMSQRYYNPGSAMPQVNDDPQLLNTVPAAPLPDALRQFAGYRWNTYTPDLAIVDIAFRWISGPTTGAVYLATYTLTWADNDWKLVSPGSGGVPVHAVDATIANQYTPWGP